MAESLESATLNPNSDLPCTANGRAEIDTSTPLESVKEAATRFGGFGFWKPSHKNVSTTFQENVKETDVMKLKAEAAELQNDLIVKEGETLEVIKELEASKARVEELSSKLQLENEAYEVELLRGGGGEEVHGRFKQAGVVLKDLNEAKMRLCKTTVDLSGMRGSVDQLRKMLQEERDALEKTRERVEQKATAEIEHTRARIETAKMRLAAARKIKEAARAAEAVVITEIKSTNEAVRVISTREAEEETKMRVEEVNVSKTDVLKKVDEAAQETESSKRALEEAAGKVKAEQALRQRRSENREGKRSSSVNNTARFKNRRETTTTGLRDVNGLNLTKDVVVVDGSSSSSSSALKPSMSIGQILSKKLLVTDTNVSGECRKISLGQMLANSSDGEMRTVSRRREGKENGKRSATRKRKSFGFAKISLLFNKENKKTKTKKKIDLNLR